MTVPVTCFFSQRTDIKTSNVKKTVAKDLATGPELSSERFDNLPRRLLEGWEIIVTLSPSVSKILLMFSACVSLPQPSSPSTTISLRFYTPIVVSRNATARGMTTLSTEPGVIASSKATRAATTTANTGSNAGGLVG